MLNTLLAQRPGNVQASPALANKLEHARYGSFNALLISAITVASASLATALRSASLASRWAKRPSAQAA